MVVKGIFPTPISTIKWENNLSDDQINYIMSIPSSTGSSHRISDDHNILDNEILKNLRDWIDKNLKQFYKLIFEKDNSLPYITQSWINFSDYGMFTHHHNHPNSIISGVFYIKANDIINFHRMQNGLKIASSESNEWNFNTYSFDAMTNNLLMFPSDLYHSVPKNDTNETRVSIAFNSFATGTFGQNQYLTHLEI